MNEGQQIFTILYGVYSAIVLSLVRPLQPFDTPAMYKKDTYAWKRFLVSIFWINLVPFMFFFLIYWFLGNFSGSKINFGSALGIFCFSLVIFGFYRIYWGIMLKRPNNQGIYRHYGWRLPKSLKVELENRGAEQREYEPHLVPGIWWFVIFTLLGFVFYYFSQQLFRERLFALLGY